MKITNLRGYKHKKEFTEKDLSIVLELFHNGLLEEMIILGKTVDGEKIITSSNALTVAEVRGRFRDFIINPMEYLDKE